MKNINIKFLFIFKVILIFLFKIINNFMYNISILSKLPKKIEFKDSRKSKIKSMVKLDKLISLLSANTFFFIDYFFIKIFYFNSNIYKNLVLMFRLNQTSWNFYKIRNKNIGLFNSIFFGLKTLWNFLKYWVVGLFLFFFISYYFLYIRALPINKIIFEWILIIMFIYWLISGFVFFIKKYQYSKFTSVIQRFWKRSYILFWLIESGVFLVFFYLTINAPSEPFYMYDQIRPLKFFLFSWRLFILKILPIFFLIIVGYYLQLSIKWNIFNKSSLFILIITLILLYIVWLEFYQFFHIINFYGNLLWVYDSDEFIWNLEIDFRRTRIQNNLITICLIAKFWHLIFIFIFWVFFVLRVSEVSRIRYPLLVANLQNFIILYIMSWLYMIPWLKFIFRKFLNINYYWFFSNFRLIGFRVFFYDLKLFFFSIINFNQISINKIFNEKSFFYWNIFSNFTSSNQFKNNFTRDYFIVILNS